MEQRAKTEQHISQSAGNLLKTLPPTESYDQIILTSEEEKEALRLARKAKALHQQWEQYSKKIKEPEVYPTLTTDQLRRYAATRALELIPGFVLDDTNRHIFELLCQYYSGNVEFEKAREGFSLNKGILLIGPIGCGKTSMLRIFSVNSFNPFGLVSCRKVGDDYSKLGADSIETYSGVKPVYAHQYFGHGWIGYGFDDLGTERVKKHFGNEINVMAEVILNRYDNLELRGKTHLTSNLAVEQIEEIYGSRVRSRLREMCNMITYNTEAPDRRK